MAITSKVSKTTGIVFTTLHFLQLTNGPNYLESYIILDMKGLPGLNNLAYWAHSMKKTKSCK